MDKLSKKISALIIGFLSTIAILFFLILPTISEIKTISTGIADKKSVLEKKSFANQDIKKKLERINKIKKSPEFYSSFIIPGQELDFIKTIEKIANRYSIKQDLKIVNQADINKEYLSLSINLAGDYISLIKYLTSLEKEKYYINIQSIILSSNKKIKKTNETNINNEQKKEDQLKLVIKAKVYFK
ncbi:MAG: hypothetical protein U9O55_03625 [Patescibacteria group bacterium]|nr:hypothetical protein [Patescibacteria group bacterium]